MKRWKWILLLAPLTVYSERLDVSFELNPEYINFSDRVSSSLAPEDVASLLEDGNSEQVFNALARHISDSDRNLIKDTLLVGTQGSQPKDEKIASRPKVVQRSSKEAVKVSPKEQSDSKAVVAAAGSGKKRNGITITKKRVSSPKPKAKNRESNVPQAAAKSPEVKSKIESSVNFRVRQKEEVANQKARKDSQSSVVSQSSKSHKKPEEKNLVEKFSELDKKVTALDVSEMQSDQEIPKEHIVLEGSIVGHSVEESQKVAVVEPVQEMEPVVLVEEIVVAPAEEVVEMEVAQELAVVEPVQEMESANLVEEIVATPVEEIVEMEVAQELAVVEPVQEMEPVALVEEIV
ncbi:MAG: hypothetical protein FJZ57_01250, partial [Chlamydiae bacterium]|nr:hypothetical protein [Chlamydiota bacterium]